jgi:hypothetical protein
MRAMPIRTSNRAALIATASFVLALGAAVGPAEGQAFAQQGADAAKTQDQKKENTGAAAGTAAPTEEQQKAEEDKQAEEAKKAEEAKHEQEQKELDLSKESAKAVYFSGDIGFTRSDLGGLSDKTGFDRTVANGLLYGLSAGLRLKDLRLGARWRVYDTTEFALWTFALSAGYGLPIRPISPVFSAHVGYVFDQDLQASLFRKSLPDGTILPPDVDVKGLLAGVDVNASYWVTRFVRLGVFIGADLMFLNRSRADVPRTLFGNPPAETSALPLYADSGSSIGLNFNAGLRGAFDIAFK